MDYSRERVYDLSAVRQKASKVSQRSARQGRLSQRAPLRVAEKWPCVIEPLRELSLERHRLFLAKSRLVEAPLDSTAGERPNFRTTQWGLVATASAEGAAEARVALERIYADPRR